MSLLNHVPVATCWAPIEKLAANEMNLNCDEKSLVSSEILSQAFIPLVSFFLDFPEVCSLGCLHSGMVRGNSSLSRLKDSLVH